jgi:hypothetical protein
MSTFMDTSWIDSKLIEMYGQTIKIRSKVTDVDENGNIINEYYKDPVETIGWVIPFTTNREDIQLYGIRIEGDYSVLVDKSLTVKDNDLITFNNGTQVEVREIIEYFEFNNSTYKELITRKENAGK